MLLMYLIKYETATCFVFRIHGFIFPKMRNSTTSVVKLHLFGMRQIYLMQFGGQRVPGLFL